MKNKDGSHYKLPPIDQGQVPSACGAHGDELYQSLQGHQGRKGRQRNEDKGNEGHQKNPKRSRLSWRSSLMNLPRRDRSRVTTNSQMATMIIAILRTRKVRKSKRTPPSMPPLRSHWGGCPDLFMNFCKIEFLCRIKTKPLSHSLKG